MEWAGFSENFADGKKKGKSRPGSVKKSWCQLQRIEFTSQIHVAIKNYTEQRSSAQQVRKDSKMYHWCANMKTRDDKEEIIITSI